MCSRAGPCIRLALPDVLNRAAATGVVRTLRGCASALATRSRVVVSFSPPAWPRNTASTPTVEGGWALATRFRSSRVRCSGRRSLWRSAPPGGGPRAGRSAARSSPVSPRTWARSLPSRPDPPGITATYRRQTRTAHEADRYPRCARAAHFARGWCVRYPRRPDAGHPLRNAPTSAKREGPAMWPCEV